MNGARPAPAGPRGFGPFHGEVKLFCARCGASGMAQLVGEACGNCPACDGPLQRRPPMATARPMPAASRGFGSYRAAPPVDPVQWAQNPCRPKPLNTEQKLQAEIDRLRDRVALAESALKDPQVVHAAEVLLCCRGLLDVVETGVTSLGAIRAARAVIAKVAAEAAS